MSEAHRSSRREFLSTAANATAVGMAVPTLIPRNALAAAGRPGANDRIRLGLIGCGARGAAVLRSCVRFPDVVATALCDVWKAHLDALGAQYKDAKTYRDYRELLQDEDVDAVIIATPHHWHCRQAVDACEAGKDLYLEKPMVLHLAESRVVKNAVLKHNRVYQHGTQNHASDNYRRVVEWVRSGKLGKITLVRCFLSQNEAPDGEGFPPDSDPPEGLDWDFWAGPAPIRPFNANIVKSGYAHTLFLDYGGGRTCGMSEHIFDLPFWALGLQLPTRVSSFSSKRCVQDNTDAPDTHEVTFEFPEVTLTWSMSQVTNFGFNLQEVKPFGEHDEPPSVEPRVYEQTELRRADLGPQIRSGVQRRLGYYLQGVEGVLYGTYGSYNVVPQTPTLGEAKPPEKSIPPSPGHEREWLDCIRTRNEPSCNVRYAHKLSTANMLANLAMKVGRDLRFDPDTETIIGDAEAAGLAKPDYRDPWRFPEEYFY